MPPKKAGNKASKKSEDKKKEKTIVDKTFGLKNKNKSKSVQKYIKGVEAQVKGNQSAKAKEIELMRKKQKEEEEERKRLEASLFKPTVGKTKVPTGVDPKSVVCEFFKKGLCTKGDKCKFSHNLEQHRKAEKIDLYTDQRDAEEKAGLIQIDVLTVKADGMESWDQDKLEEVVKSKQGEVNRNLKTKIVCKHFLDAIESKKYGWFWECPNGKKCMYMHSLPPGFVLKSKQKEELQDTEEGPTLEEQIEEERAQLLTRTPLTFESFSKWKEEKAKEKEKKDIEDKAKREADIKSGKAMRSGREMFVYNPELFVDDEGVIDFTEFEPEEKDEGPVVTLSATGTSISAVTSNGPKSADGEPEAKESGKVEVEEDLFLEDDIPDEDED